MVNKRELYLYTWYYKLLCGKCNLNVEIGSYLFKKKCLMSPKIFFFLSLKGNKSLWTFGLLYKSRTRKRKKRKPIEFKRNEKKRKEKKILHMTKVLSGPWRKYIKFSQKMWGPLFPFFSFTNKTKLTSVALHSSPPGAYIDLVAAWAGCLGCWWEFQ